MIVQVNPELAPGIAEELVALAKADNREDFFFLAGSAGVPLDRREALWQGTRARLNKPAEVKYPVTVTETWYWPSPEDPPLLDVRPREGSWQDLFWRTPVLVRAWRTDIL